MKKLYVVDEFVPIGVELINNAMDRVLNRCAKEGYTIDAVDSLKNLKRGEKYLDSKLEIKIKE